MRTIHDPREMQRLVEEEISVRDFRGILQENDDMIWEKCLGKENPHR